MISVRITASLHLALCAVVILSGCGDESHVDYLASGKRYMAEQNYAAAVIELKNAVRTAPQEGEARYLLGNGLHELGDFSAAEIELRKAAAIGHAPELVRPALVRALIAQGQFEKALGEAEDPTITAATAKAQLQALTGEALLGLGRVDKAHAAFTQALAIDTANDTATLGLGRIAGIRRDFGAAHAAVDSVLLHAPTALPALLLKADLLAAEERVPEAVVAYERAIKVEPNNQRAHLGLVPLLLGQKDLGKARQRVDALKAATPKAPGTLYLDALVSYSERNLSQARDAVQQLLKMTPDHTPSLLLAATVDYDTEHYAQAEQNLRKVLSVTPRSHYPRRLLVATYLRTGQADRARDALEPLLKEQSEDGAVLQLAGEVALANGDMREAAKYFQLASEREPRNVAARVRLGQARLAAGQTERGIEDLEVAARLDDRDYRADVALVTLHLHRRQVDKALAAVQALEHKQPRNPLTYNLAGLVLLAKQDGAQARARFEQALALEPLYLPAAHNLALLDRRDGKLDAARQRYEAILARDPHREQALIALAQHLQQTGAPPSEVEAVIERAIAGNPASVRAHLLKIGYLLRRGEAKRALTAAQQARAELPQDRLVLAALGRAQLGAGESDQAIATFGKLAAMEPQAIAPLLGQAEAFAASQAWDSAREALNKALKLQPDLLAARRGLIQMSVRAKDFEQAQADARDIQTRWPDRAVGYVAQAAVLQTQGKTEDAETLMRSTLAKFRTGEMLIATYALLLQQGKKQEAETLAQDWLKNHPKDAGVPAYAGQANLAAKDYATAARWYKAALQAQPENAAMVNNVAWSLGLLKDPSAMEYAQRALKLAPRNAAVLDTAGWLHVQQGEIDAGLKLLESAHAAAPSHAAIRLNLAKALLKAGRDSEARQHLQALSALPARSSVRVEAEQLLAVN